MRNDDSFHYVSLLSDK